MPRLQVKNKQQRGTENQQVSPFLETKKCSEELGLRALDLQNKRAETMDRKKARHLKDSSSSGQRQCHRTRTTKLSG